VNAAADIIERVRQRSMSATFESSVPHDDEPARLRQPPHSIEAEQSVLGGLLADSAALGRISDLIVEADFYRHEHRMIFGAIERVARRGAPVDIVTVFEQLEGETHDFGGLPYLNSLALSVPSTANIRRYAEIVAERATLRQIIAAADEQATRAFNANGHSAAELLERAGAELRRIADVRKAKGRKLPLLTLDELAERALATRWLVKHLIPAESVGMLFGGSGTFKSFIALDAALHVARGLPWIGRRTKAGSVLYIAAEGGTGLAWRSEAWHRSRRLQRRDSPLRVVPAAMDLRQDAWRVVEAAQAVGVTPALVVVDTMSQTFGGEENSATDVAGYLREIGARFRDLWHCAVLLVHHTGHQETERPRGSAAIQANTDYLYGIARDEKEMLATMSCTHRKDGESFPDATFQLSKWTLGQDDDGDDVTSLVARHLSSAEEVEEAMQSEAKAGRVGKNQLLLQLAQNGAKEADLRKAFQDECGLTDAESRRRVWNRAKGWAVKSGFLDFAEGYVITLKTHRSGT
jgi:KaiC/GvpD/RAD55 family RecA-like ATPase